MNESNNPNPNPTSKDIKDSKEHWIGFWGTVSNSIIVGVFGLITLVVGTFLASRNPATPTQPASTSSQPSSLAVSDEGYGKVVTAESPYPQNLGMVTLEMRLSEVKALKLPNGTLDPLGYSFEVASGPFKSVLCHFDGVVGEQNDPKVDRLSYAFRDDNAGTYVRRQAVEVFGSKKMKSEDSGETMKWPDVHRCKVEIDSGYYKVAP